MLKKYNNQKNIAGLLLEKAREEKEMTKAELSKRLELKGVIRFRMLLINNS